MDFNEEFRFGSASWATRQDVRRSGLYRASGPFLGYFDGRQLRLNGDGPLTTFGGAGSGKLRDVIAYILCGFRDLEGRWHAPSRLLVNDPRGELAAISIGNQIRFGKPAFFVNPFGLHGLPQHRVNPWDVICAKTLTFDADVKLLVADLIPLARSGGEQYFPRRARDWAEALVKDHAVWHGPITLTDFYKIVNTIEDPSGWEIIAERMLHSADDAVRRVAAEMDFKRREAPKEYSGIIGTIYENIGFLSDANVRHALSGADFSLDVLCKQDCNVYVMIPAEYLDLLAPMQRAIFGSAMLYKNRHPSAPRVLFLIDEAAQLGKFDALMRAYAYGRGMGIQAWSFWQDPGQIARNFGRDAVSSFLNSSVCRQFFGVRDYETALTVSKMLGQETLAFNEPLHQGQAKEARRQALRGLLEGANPYDLGAAIAHFRRTSETRTLQARALMTPDEVMNMPDNKQVLFVSGLNVKPIFADKYPYFTRREMAGAYLPNPYHGPRDRVRIAARWRKSAPVITERVPAHLAHWPQHQSGEWSYVEGYKPV